MCILRAYGKHFAVNDFLKESSLRPSIVYEIGEKYSETKFSEDSGFNIPISNAEFHDLEGQIKDVIAFLQIEDKELKRLSKYPNVESITVDFAINIPPDEIVVWSRGFPVALLSLLSASNIDLEFTVYPQVNNEE